MSPMFHGWSEFYLFVGSAAAVLIGLIFVVISLMQDRSRSAVLAGSKLYMGPIVLSLSFTLVLSAAALVPEIDTGRFALVSGIVALWGLARGIMSTAGIWRLGAGNKVHWTDAWFYGVIPSLLYFVLAGVAAALGAGLSWAADGLALVVMGILLNAIRNEWDLITWLAPRQDKPDPDFAGNEPN
jgi:hypothetical protein